MRSLIVEQLAARIANNILQEALGPLEQDARPENTTFANWANTIPDTRRPGVWNVAAQDAYNELIDALRLVLKSFHFGKGNILDWLKNYKRHPIAYGSMKYRRIDKKVWKARQIKILESMETE